MIDLEDTTTATFALAMINPKRRHRVFEVSASELHVNGAWIVIGLNIVAGVWALVANKAAWARVRQLWWFTAVAHASLLIQVTIGVVAFQADGVEVTQFHMFYGFVALASVGIVYSYKQQLEQWQYLLYGYGSLFIAGLGIRAVFLAG